MEMSASSSINTAGVSPHTEQQRTINHITNFPPKISIPTLEKPPTQFFQQNSTHNQSNLATNEQEYQQDQ
jgi:hypothetical protein